jgi:hypothetical protein
VFADKRLLLPSSSSMLSMWPHSAAGVSPLASSAFKGGGWTSRKWKTTRCKFRETVG